MNRCFASLLLLAGVVLGANEAGAAIFRIQGNTVQDEGLVQDGVNPDYKLVGEFKFETSYRDANGNVVNGVTPSISAWNISVKDLGGNLLNRYTSGYSAPLAGGLTDNSTSTGATASSFTLACTNVSGCSGSTPLVISLASGTFNDIIGDSVGGSTRFVGLGTSTSYDGRTTSAILAQVDFVPVSIPLLALAPAAFLVRKLRAPQG